MLIMCIQKHNWFLCIREHTLTQGISPSYFSSSSTLLIPYQHKSSPLNRSSRDIVRNDGRNEPTKVYWEMFVLVGLINDQIVIVWALGTLQFIALNTVVNYNQWVAMTLAGEFLVIGYIQLDTGNCLLEGLKKRLFMGQRAVFNGV